jgi:hypothetical protein
LFEDPDYLSAKRYADIIKTMWFSFFFGGIIPIGTHKKLNIFRSYFIIVWTDSILLC